MSIRQKDRQSERYLGIFNISPTLPFPLTYPSLRDTFFQPVLFNADNFFSLLSFSMVVCMYIRRAYLLKHRQLLSGYNTDQNDTLLASTH